MLMLLSDNPRNALMTVRMRLLMMLTQAARYASRLRTRGFSADYSFKKQSLGKQLKEANRRGARKAAIVRGDEVALKDLSTGAQTDQPLSEFLENPTKQ